MAETDKYDKTWVLGKLQNRWNNEIWISEGLILRIHMIISQIGRDASEEKTIIVINWQCTRQESLTQDSNWWWRDNKYLLRP